MRAVICSLLEIEDIDSVPNFIELSQKWYSEMHAFISDRGYKLNYTGL